MPGRDPFWETPDKRIRVSKDDRMFKGLALAVLRHTRVQLGGNRQMRTNQPLPDNDANDFAYFQTPRMHSNQCASRSGRHHRHDLRTQGRILLDLKGYGKRAHLLPVKEKTPSLARKIARLVLIAARAQAKLRDWFAVVAKIT